VKRKRSIDGLKIQPLKTLMVSAAADALQFKIGSDTFSEVTRRFKRSNLSDGS